MFRIVDVSYLVLSEAFGYVRLGSDGMEALADFKSGLSDGMSRHAFQ